MYGGAPGWPGTTSDALGLSVPPEGARKGQGGGGDFLGGSGRKRRDSIAPSINIQAPVRLLRSHLDAFDTSGI